MGIKVKIKLFKKFGQRFVGQNFRQTKFFFGQNFRHQAKISSILSDEFLSDKVFNTFHSWKRPDRFHRVYCKCEENIARKLVVNKMNPKLTLFVRKMHRVPDLMSIRLIKRGLMEKFFIKKFLKKECARARLIFQG